MASAPLESDGRAAASKAVRAGSIPARGTPLRGYQLTGEIIPPFRWTGVA